ncbi:MAG: hypothetical protein Q7T57_05190 [Dehalococcoidales bacterium]|nr:hypothetical protein [Dehalococcoidales bacterium]
MMPIAKPQRALTRAESFLKVVQSNSVEFEYCQAWAKRDAAMFAGCFDERAKYRSFLVQTQLSARSKRVSPSSTDTSPVDELSAVDFPRFFESLTRDIREWQVTFHSIAHSAATTVLEYTLRGVWSGRLPSMTVGVYDKPIALRCIDMLRWDDAHRAIQRVDVMTDRYDFLVQIGMAQAKL